MCNMLLFNLVIYNNFDLLFLLVQMYDLYGFPWNYSFKYVQSG